MTTGGDVLPAGLEADVTALHALIVAWSIIAADVVGGAGDAEEMEARRLAAALEKAVRKRVRAFAVTWGGRGRV